MLTFDETIHQYCIDGVAVPSVTQLVSPLGDDFDDMDADLELTVEAAADRGVTMHAYLAHRLDGGEPEDFELPGQYLAYADAVELFLSEHIITPMLIETPLAGDATPVPRIWWVSLTVPCLSWITNLSLKFARPG